MDAQQATRGFKQAEALYANGRHEEALQILQKLDQAFPNNKNILYPKALCLAALNRHDEAAAACDTLDALNDPRGQAVRQKLTPPAQDDALGLGLDALDILGDLDKPAPKRTPRVQPQAASNIGLYLKIAGAVAVVAIVGALIATGTLGKLLPKRETVESALVKIDEASSAITACSGNFAGEANLTQPMPMTINLAGDFDVLMQDEKPLVYANTSVSIASLGMSQNVKVVIDGDNMWQEMNTGGQLAVMKMPASSGGVSADISPTELLDMIKKVGEVKLLKDETIDGQPAFVFSVTPSPTFEAPSGLPKFTSIKVAVVKESGIPVLAEVKDEAGKMVLNLSISGLVVNNPSSPQKFKYTPPPNAQVMDMSAMQGGKLPFPIPGM